MRAAFVFFVLCCVATPAVAVSRRRRTTSDGTTSGASTTTSGGGDVGTTYYTSYSGTTSSGYAKPSSCRSCHRSSSTGLFHSRTFWFWYGGRRRHCRTCGKNTQYDAEVEAIFLRGIEGTVSVAIINSSLSGSNVSEAMPGLSTTIQDKVTQVWSPSLSPSELGLIDDVTVTMPLAGTCVGASCTPVVEVTFLMMFEDPSLAEDAVHDHIATLQQACVAEASAASSGPAFWISQCGTFRAFSVTLGSEIGDPLDYEVNVLVSKNSHAAGAFGTTPLLYCGTLLGLVLGWRMLP